MLQGNNRRLLFSSEPDRRLFLSLVEDALERYPVALHHLSLMPNHMHMAATPPTKEICSKFIQSFAQRYAQRRNWKRGGSGKLFRERYKTNTSAYWLARLEAQDLLCAPVKTLREALVDPQTLHNRMLLEGDDGEQVMRVVGSPIEMSAAPVTMRQTPPRLGEHTEQILDEARINAESRR